MLQVPQQAVLAHPRTLLFVTHCGMHGVLEAVHHGVPMVGMPVFIDQVRYQKHMTRTEHLHAVSDRVYCLALGLFCDRYHQEVPPFC